MWATVEQAASLKNMPERGNKFIDPKKKFVVHQDQEEWLWNYRGNDTPIESLFKLRAEALQNGVKFWDDTHDEEMKETARERNKTIGRGLLCWLRGGK